MTASLDDPSITSDDPPGPSAPLFDPAPWREAQRAAAADLAALCLLLGTLGERLRSGPAGWTHRLALLEAAGLSWWAGDRIDAERLALWAGGRIGGAGEDAAPLARAGWALRRLSSDGAPLTDLGAFFDRRGQEAAATADLAEIDPAPPGLHPVVAAARVFHLWRLRGPDGPAPAIEAAVLAMRLGIPPLPAPSSSLGGAGLVFLPLVRPSPLALHRAGSASVRLGAWLEGATRAALSALHETGRLTLWEREARAVLAPRSGSSLDRLIDLLRDWPHVSAPMAEARTGASRATVERDLARLEASGVLREVTGQARYRVWSARLPP